MDRAIFARITMAAACLGFVMALAGPAQAQRVGYRLQNRVAVGVKPSIILEAGEDMQKIELVLTRQDGQSQRFERKNLKAGQEIEFSFIQAEGTSKYTAAIKMWTKAGQSATTFDFDAVVARRVTVKVLKDKTDVDARRVTLQSDGLMTSAELEVSGEAGLIASRKIDLSSVAAGVPFEVTWEGEGAASRINIKVHDPAGFWVGLELIPFSVDIPHEEVVFDSGKSTFAEAEARKLDATLKLLMAEIEKYGSDLEINLYVAGYTDTVGGADANVALSFARARAISAWFRQKGLHIPIYFQGFGEGVLAVQTADEVDEARNRRALYILGSQSPPTSGQIPRADWRHLP